MDNSPRRRTTVPSDIFKTTRSRMPSDPIIRVKEQSLNSEMFTHDEYGPALRADIEHHKIVVKDAHVNNKK
jgi:hypothetical protein